MLTNIMISNKLFCNMSSPKEEFFDAKSEISEPLSPIILSPTKEDTTQKTASPIKSASQANSIDVSPLNSKANSNSSLSPKLENSSKDKSPTLPRIDGAIKGDIIQEEDGQTIQFQNEPQEEPEEIPELPNDTNDDLAKEFASLMEQRELENTQDEDEDDLFKGEKLEMDQENVQIAPISFGLKLKQSTPQPIVQAITSVDDDDEFDDFETFSTTVVEPNEINKIEESPPEPVKVEELKTLENSEDLDFINTFLEKQNLGIDKLVEFFIDSLPFDIDSKTFEDHYSEIGDIVDYSTPYGKRLYFEPTEYVKEIKEYQKMSNIFEKSHVPSDQKPFVWQKSNFRRKLLQISGIPLNLDEFYTSTSKRKFGPLSQNEVALIEQVIQFTESLDEKQLKDKKLEELGTIHLDVEKALGRVLDANSWYKEQISKLNSVIEAANQEIKDALQEAQSKKKQSAKKRYFY
eukprot:NODE_142_length_15935_cov_1.439126.p4 type:complete len:462 gc:universal NODE_142_length_15935_cov_1.439126:9717-11102(+)